MKARPSLILITQSQKAINSAWGRAYVSERTRTFICAEDPDRAVFKFEQNKLDLRIEPSTAPSEYGVGVSLSLSVCVCGDTGRGTNGVGNEQPEEEIIWLAVAGWQQLSAPTCLGWASSQPSDYH